MTKDLFWNPSNCECEPDKSCDVGEYLDYENCKCRKKLVDKLVEECTENIDEVKIAGIALLEHECVWSYAICVVLAVIALTISIGIGAYCVNYKYMNHNKKTVSTYNYVYQATNY